MSVAPDVFPCQGRGGLSCGVASGGRATQRVMPGHTLALRHSSDAAVDWIWAGAELLQDRVMIFFFHFLFPFNTYKDQWKGLQ